MNVEVISLSSNEVYVEAKGWSLSEAFLEPALPVVLNLALRSHFMEVSYERHEDPEIDGH